MTERAPQASERITSGGLIVESFRRFVSQLDGILKATLSISPSIRTFSDETELNNTFLNPRQDQIVWVEGSGLCRFNGTIWLKYDDTPL